MPARIIDGDALWRSDKLAKIEPAWYRAEYANLIPLALADGTFECNPKRVWADVYSYNRPDIDISDVEKLLDELERVGLLVRKTDENDKIWGFWVGIEKRLPCEAHRERYKNGNSSVFNTLDNIRSQSGVNPDEVRPRLDKIRLDKIAADKDSDFSNIRKVYRDTIHKSCSSRKDYVRQYAKYCQEYGEELVLIACKLWAEDNQWRDKKPDLHFFFQDISSWIEAAKEESSNSLAEKTNYEQQQKEIEVAFATAQETETHKLLKIQDAEREREKQAVAELEKNPYAF